MEEYEEFARRCLFWLREANDKRAAELPSHRGSSLIRFHGVTILPPLLTVQRREEVLKHKHEAIELTKQRSVAQLDPRVLQMQTFLDSVQLRKAPTFWEFIHSDPDVDMPGSTNYHWKTSSPMCSTAKPVKENNLSSHYLGRGSPDKMCHVSDTSSAPVCGSDIYPNPEIPSRVSHRSLSSGYITNDNMEVTGHTNFSVEHGPLAKDGYQVTQENPTLPKTDYLPDCPHTVPDKNWVSQQLVKAGSCEPCDPVVCEDPYRMSLQNLLKRSQEYRKRQRQLRLAKAGARVSGEALSDKENDEYLSVEKTGLMKSRERRSNNAKVQFLKSDLSCLDMPSQSSVKSDSSATSKAGKECCEKEFYSGGVDASKDAQLNIQGSAVFCLSSETSTTGHLDGRRLTQSKVIDSPVDRLSKLRLTVDTCNKSFGLSQGKKKVDGVPQAILGGGKFRTFPSPQLCASPVRCNKSRSSGRKLLVNTALRFDDDTGTPYQPSDNIDQSVQISQLETNLSSLKALISDLECTLNEYPSQYMPATEACLGVEQAMLGGGEQHQSTHNMTSLAQKQRVPDTNWDVPGLLHRGSILMDTTNQQAVKECGASTNRSYDVDTPSSLWLHGVEAATMVAGAESLQGRAVAVLEHAGQGLESRVKRKLLMSNEVVDLTRTLTPSEGVPSGRPRSITPKARASTRDDLQLKQSHAVQIQALVKKQQRQKQLLLQTAPGSGVKVTSQMTDLAGNTAMDSEFLPRVSVSQPSCFQSFSWRPIVAAAVRGYLTRRLLCTERIALLSRTIKDSQSFLLVLQSPAPERGESGSRQDLLLQERVLLQLRAARFEIHDVFFCSSVAEKMQIIALDRALARERELKSKENGQKTSKERASLSMATKKYLGRKRGLMMQKKVMEREQAAGSEFGCNQVHQHPCRVGTSTPTCRPRNVKWEPSV